MPLPLLLPNLMPPRLPPLLLSRTHLIEKLHRGQAGKLTLLHGASGTGKTTLLALWRRDLLIFGKRTAWLTLTKEERLTGRFFSSVVMAIEKDTPEIGKGLRLLLTAGDGVTGKLLAAALINDIALHEDINIVLMLDNYQEIVDSEVEHAINFLLENLPVNLHLVISSGSWPSLSSLSALDYSSQLLEIATDDLLLNVAEVEEYVRNVKEIALDDVACRSLHEKTEGWITGIQLALSRVRSANSSQHKLNDFSANWDAVNSYFDEVVLAKQPTHIINFLHECCLLRKFNEDLCVSVYQSLNAAENIAYIKRHNLFCYEQKNSFRFFKLFSQALKERAKGIPQEQLIQVNRRATYWYAKKEQWNEAVQYALDAGDTGLALGYIDQCAMKLVEHGDIKTLYDWIVRMEAFPGIHSLTLRIAEVWMLSFLFRFDEVNKRLLELEQEATSGLFDFNDSMLAALVSIRAMIYAFNDDFDEAGRLTAAFNENTSDLTPWLDGVICNILLMISIYSEDSSKSLHYQEIITSRSDEQNVYVRIYSDVLSGLISFKKADLAVARGYYEKALIRAENKIGHRSLGASLAVSYLSQCLYELGEATKVIGLLCDRMDEIDKTCMADGAVRAYIALIKSCREIGDLHRANEVLYRGKKLAIERGWNRLLAACLAEQALVYLQQDYLQQGNLQQGNLQQGNLQQGNLQKDSSDNVRLLLSELEQLAQAHSSCGVMLEINLYYTLTKSRLMLSQGNFAEAIDPLTLMIEQLEHRSWRYQAIPAILLLTQLYAASNKLPKAYACLHKAINIGTKGGLNKSFLDEGAPLINLIKSWLEQMYVNELPADEMNFAEQLVLFTEPTNSLELDNVDDHSTVHALEEVTLNITGKEKEILSLLSKGLTNKEIAHVLSISLGTVKWHLKNIYSKLGVTSRTEAIYESKELKVLE